MPQRSRRWVALPLLGVAVAALSGCTDQVNRGWLPSTKDTTNQTGRIMELWTGSWIAALAVGVLVWGLIGWCVVVYRRRKNDTGLPVQMRYNVPVETLTIIIPTMMVAVLFYFTARDQSAIAATDVKPDVTINVVGKQWSWDFNYVDSDVYESGVQGELDGKPGVETRLPTLVVPVNKRIEFVLQSRDVNHSFWIPAFLYKMDMLPGVTNRFQVVPQRVGTYKGKCAELCGQFHSEMLFNVQVVDEATYEARMAQLRAKGQVGQLGVDLGRADGLDKTLDQGPQGENQVGTP